LWSLHRLMRLATFCCGTWRVLSRLQRSVNTEKLFAVSRLHPREPFLRAHLATERPFAFGMCIGVLVWRL
jgi:hypothetical protein